MAESPRQEADSSTDASGKDTSVECPTCECVYDTERGMKQHHARAHGESLSGVEVECDICSEVFRKQRSRVESDEADYCSMSCKKESERNGSYNTCEVCGDSFYTRGGRDAKTCSKDCRVRFVGDKLSGINPYEYTCDLCGENFKSEEKDRVYCSKECHNKSMEDQVQAECANCGDVVTRRRYQYEHCNRHFCDFDCRREWMGENWVGEDNPQYINGKNQYRGNSWYRQRLKALRRDQARCQSCAVPESKKDRGHHVHHIVPYRKFDSWREANELSNLVTLCESCHQKWEGIELKPQLMR